MNTPTPMAIKASLILDVTASMPTQMNQGKRLVEHLAQNPRSPSGHVSQSCSISNISDVTSYVNPYLRTHNLMIGCERPITPILNQFKEKSNNFLWSIYSVPETANDEIYNQARET
jgi:hypothetical protein